MQKSEGGKGAFQDWGRTRVSWWHLVVLNIKLGETIWHDPHSQESDPTAFNMSVDSTF